MAEPRDKAEGWYLLHDMRKVDWAGWNSADERTKESAVEEAVSYLEDADGVEEGGTAVYAVVGDKADLMLVHVRPTVEALDSAERRFETTRLADFTHETASHVSVTEVGGYTNEDVENGDLSEYARSKLFPEIPDKRFVSFYPMSRKREPEQNWYKTSKSHRDEMMREHRESGEAYAGKIKQLISGSIGIDDWEWGVDLFTDDMKHAKSIVYEMRFDEASSDYSEFGPFYTGIRFPPSDLDAYLAGEEVPTGGATGGEEDDAASSVREALDEEGVYAGKPHGEDVYAAVVFSEEDVGALTDEVEGLAGNFDRYDTHVKTAVYEDVGGDGDAAVVSLWETEDAVETASGYLADLPGVVREAGEGEGFGTMGMFYTVKPDYREEFVDKFGEVGDLLAEMEGHVETRLLANLGDENDMFISSRWESEEDATEFFRSEAFRGTVDWGREVLDDRPRHVFLA